MEHPYICDDNNYEIPNFRNAEFGLLVTHSDHWYIERCLKIPKQRQLGIVVNTKLYRDSKGRVIFWPDIHWEGAVGSSTTHPMNVIAYRKHQKLPITYMDNGQWGTFGPDKNLENES